MARVIEKQIEKEMFKEARRELAREYKRLRCTHQVVLWDVTGRIGICFYCGATIKREAGGQK